MRGYKPEELFDENGKLIAGAEGTRAHRDPPHERQSSRQWRNPARRICACRTSATTLSKVDQPGTIEAENVRPFGDFLRDVMKSNMNNFRVFGPDENDIEQAAGNLRGQQEILARGVLSRGRGRRRIGAPTAV